MVLFLLPRRALILSFGINHPRNSKLIGAHAEARRPESLLERHRDGSVLSQSFKDSLTFGEVLHMDRHIRPFGLLITPRRSVGAHQYLVAQIKSRMHN